jgi:uncharacterized protein YehS (DUF1456 family)
MIHNDVIRSLRYMLAINDNKLISIAKLGGIDLLQSEIESYVKKEDEAGYVQCPDKVMSHFLNGLIYFKRGKDESRPPLATESFVSNNTILKKLRVAFELKDDDIVAILEEAGFKVTATEISSFFRKEDHRNFRPCGDQFLRNFLKGLTSRVKPT